jgi:uncharacterized membrane-anchored protein
MLYAIIALAVLNVTLLAILHSVLRSHARETADRASAYERTLQTMADRIQAPERLPLRDTATFEVPEREPDEWNQVGAITIDPDYGLSDDG